MARMTFLEFRRKEVINMRDGARLGAVCDMELDTCTGLVHAIVVPGPPRLWGLLRSDEELVIPFGKISKIGGDVILVDINM